MNILIIISLTLIVYWKVRNNYYDRLCIKYSYRLYDLRDILRECAIEKKIDSNDWRFKYLDTSFSKTIGELPNLNIITSYFISNRYRNNKTFISRKTTLMKEMSLDSTYNAIFYEYNKALLYYIFEKLFLVRLLVIFIISFHITSSGIVSKCKNSLKKIVSNIAVSPEASTSYAYCP